MLWKGTMLATIGLTLVCFACPVKHTSASLTINEVGSCLHSFQEKFFKPVLQYSPVAPLVFTIQHHLHDPLVTQMQGCSFSTEQVHFCLHLCWVYIVVIWKRGPVAILCASTWAVLQERHRIYDSGSCHIQQLYATSHSGSSGVLSPYIHN